MQNIYLIQNAQKGCYVNLHTYISQDTFMMFTMHCIGFHFHKRNPHILWCYRFQNTVCKFIEHNWVVDTVTCKTTFCTALKVNALNYRYYRALYEKIGPCVKWNDCYGFRFYFRCHEVLCKIQRDTFVLGPQWKLQIDPIWIPTAIIGSYSTLY